MSARKPGDHRAIAFTGEDGRSSVLADTTAPHTVDYIATPGMRTSVLWATHAPLELALGNPKDPILSLATLHPAPGHSIFMTLTLPPDAVYFAAGFDPAASASEHVANAPGLAERMELDAPGFHATDTVDYVVVLTGAVVLESDDGKTRLVAGDTVVQLGSRHAWRNESDTSATLAVVMLGAQRTT